MSDLISRQAAMSAIAERMKEVQNSSTSGRNFWEGLCIARSIVGDLPSAQPEVLACGEGVLNAQPEPHWIKCSERLPEKSGQYCVSGGNKVWICEFLIIPNFTAGWCNNVTNPVVQAWVPCKIPEPYREGES